MVCPDEDFIQRIGLMAKAGRNQGLFRGENMFEQPDVRPGPAGRKTNGLAVQMLLEFYIGLVAHGRCLLHLHVIGHFPGVVN